MDFIKRLEPVWLALVVVGASISPPARHTRSLRPPR